MEEIQDESIDDKEMIIDFKESPLQISSKTARYFSYNPNIMPNNSKILYQDDSSKFHTKIVFYFSFQMSHISDFRMNIFEMNIERKYILIAADSKVMVIPFDKLNLTFGKPQVLLECNDIINHIKIMKTDTNEDICLVLLNNGLLYTKKIVIINQIIEETPIKIFNCRIDANDNSIWSVDCQFPYIIIGGNHCTILLFNYNELIDQEESKSIIYEGNEHNIPTVSISECGLFICSNSIDGYGKIFDLNKGKLLLKIPNKKKDWGWNIKLIKKSLFNHISAPTDTADENETNQIIQLLGLTNVAKDNKAPLKSSSFIDDLSPYEMFLYDNLINKYYLLSSCQQSVTFHEICLENNNDQKEKRLQPLSVGKIELLKNFIQKKYVSTDNLDVYNIFMIKNMMQYSRYEFVHIAESSKLIIIGNKNCDIQVYSMAIEIDKTNKTIGITDKPIAIIDCNERIVGIKIEEKGSTHVNIYALCLSGMLYCYQITKDD